jgi:hypothetical protein
VLSVHDRGALDSAGDARTREREAAPDGAEPDAMMANGQMTEIDAADDEMVQSTGTIEARAAWHG